MLERRGAQAGDVWNGEHYITIGLGTVTTKAPVTGGGIARGTDLTLELK